MDNDVKNMSGAQFPQPAEDFAVKSATTAFKFLREDVPPPFPCYVGVDDQLLLTFCFDNNGNSLICNVRILRDDGKIIPIVFIVPIPAARTVVTQRFQLVEGFLLSVSLLTPNPTATGSPAYASAALIRPPNTAAAQYETLCAGYVNSVIAISYPQTPPQRPTDGAGIIRSFAITPPAAGADFTFTVNTLTRLRIISISATLTTAVAVANRNVELVIDDGANVVAEIDSGFSQLASLVNDYTWMDSGPIGAAFDNVVVLPLPANLILPAGFRISSETTGIQAADQWSAIRMLVSEWLDLG